MPSNLAAGIPGAVIGWIWCGPGPWRLVGWSLLAISALLLACRTFLRLGSSLQPVLPDRNPALALVTQRAYGPAAPPL